MSTLLFQTQSVLIYALLVAGAFFRKSRVKHIPIMLLAILWDIILVAQIELNRNAVEKVVQATSNTFMLNIHVSFAVTSVLFYFLLLFTGRKLYEGKENLRVVHRLFGWSTLVLRSLTLITSFFVVVIKK